LRKQEISHFDSFEIFWVVSSSLGDKSPSVPRLKISESLRPFYVIFHIMASDKRNLHWKNLPPSAAKMLASMAIF
jgi:hypothetical protein